MGPVGASSPPRLSLVSVRPPIHCQAVLPFFRSVVTHSCIPKSARPTVVCGSERTLSNSLVRERSRLRAATCCYSRPSPSSASTGSRPTACCSLGLQGCSLRLAVPAARRRRRQSLLGSRRPGQLRTSSPSTCASLFALPVRASTSDTVLGNSETVELEAPGSLFPFISFLCSHPHSTELLRDPLSPLSQHRAQRLANAGVNPVFAPEGALKPAETFALLEASAMRSLLFRAKGVREGIRLALANRETSVLLEGMRGVWEEREAEIAAAFRGSGTSEPGEATTTAQMVLAEDEVKPSCESWIDVRGVKACSEDEFWDLLGAEQKDKTTPVELPDRYGRLRSRSPVRSALLTPSTTKASSRPPSPVCTPSTTSRRALPISHASSSTPRQPRRLSPASSPSSSRSPTQSRPRSRTPKRRPRPSLAPLRRLSLLRRGLAFRGCSSSCAGSRARRHKRSRGSSSSAGTAQRSISRRATTSCSTTASPLRAPRAASLRMTYSRSRAARRPRWRRSRKATWRVCRPCCRSRPRREADPPDLSQTSASALLSSSSNPKTLSAPLSTSLRLSRASPRTSRPSWPTRTRTCCPRSR